MPLLKTLSALLLAVPAVLALDPQPADFGGPKPEGPYELVVPRAALPPVIDGDLADAAWAKAAAVKPFWRAGATDLAEAQSLAWLCFDKDNLYVAWACLDAKIIAEPVARDDKAVWRHDCVELFLSPERDARTERQFMLSVAESVYDRRPGKEFGPGGADWNPKWQGKVKRQPWGYTAEMSVPLAEVSDVKKFPVVRGTVWTMKLTREDYGDHKGVITSSWTPMGPNTGDLRSVGKLIFEDRNFLVNGGAEIVDANGGLPGWAVAATKVDVKITAADAEKTEGARGAKIALSGRKTTGANARIWPGTESLPPAPADTTYFFTADVKALCPDDTLVAYFVAFQGEQPVQVNFKHNAGWQKIKATVTAVAGASIAVPCLQAAAAGKTDEKPDGAGVVYIDNARMEVADMQQIGVDPDSYCLTGNATEAYRTRNRRVPGTYTYTEPMTTDPSFPCYYAPGDGPPQDYGLYRGEVPFDKGRLTDGQTVTTVMWPSFWTGHQGHDVTFDLKAEYQVTRVVVKTSWPGLRINNVFLKSPGEPVYTLVAAMPDRIALKGGAGSEAMQRVDERAFNAINQPARWVRVQTECRAPGQYAEIEIWGKELPASGPRPKRVPYLLAAGGSPVKDPQGQPEPTWAVPPLFPTPKEMKLSGPAVALNDGLVIHFEPVASARARTTAEVLRDELKLCLGIESSVEPAAAGRPATVLLGEASDSPRTAEALKQLGLALTPASPGYDGYVFAAQGGRIVIGGSDPRGAFYGAQTLLTLARKTPAGGWEVPGASLRDWPDMKFRIIEGRAIPTQGLVRALARFRINYYTAKYQFIHQSIEHDKFAERYFVNFIPFLDFNSIVIDTDPSLAERPPDERWEDLPKDARRNANPGHPRTWEIYFGILDKYLPKFHGDILYIGMDETYQHNHGSRWNVSPESRALNMSAGPLLAWTISKIDAKAKQYGKRVFMHDTPFCRDHRLSYKGDPDPSWRKAIPLLPKDVMFNVWHWNKKWVLEPLGKQGGFELVYLCTGDRDWRPPAKVDPDEDTVPFEFPGYFAGINNYMAEGSFTASKLLETAGVAWNPKAPRPKDPAVNAAVAHYMALWNRLHVGDAMPPSLSATPADFIPVDLSVAANLGRVDEVAYDGKGWVDIGPNADLRALKPGVLPMAGIPFTIIDEAKNAGKSVVAVQNRMYTDKTLPDAVEIDVKGLKAASLIFLHCLDNAPGSNYLRRSELAGYYFFIYEDGTYARREIKYAVNTGNWDGLKLPWEYAPAGDTMPAGKLAWRGPTASGLMAHLYMTEWTNPRPNLRIMKILLRSTFDATQMNPILLAVTAVHPRLAPAPAPDPLPSADRLLPPKTSGLPIDLAGGRDESELRYVAPDGTLIEADRIDNALSDKKSSAFSNDWRSYVGLVTIDGRQCARTDTLRFTFPKATPLTGALVCARFREQRKTQDFPPMIYDIFLDVSADGGKTWQQKAVVQNTTPEEVGPVWLALDGAPVQAVRLRQTQGPNTHYAGFATVQFYRKP
jgi:hypothetical protein